MGVNDEAASRAQVAQRFNNRPPGWSRIDDRVKLLRRPIRRVTRPGGPKLLCELSGGRVSGKYIDLRFGKPESDYLKYQVGGTPKPGQPQEFPILEIG